MELDVAPQDVPKTPLLRKQKKHKKSRSMPPQSAKVDFHNIQQLLPQSRFQIEQAESFVQPVKVYKNRDFSAPQKTQENASSSSQTQVQQSMFYLPPLKK
ncbi:Hypothetical_protein [Hexamita inflata]|uniref:Hypothetical_protein n=1 Tax=Hexamita inflata TaxID=28002 RepID=A0AA86P090_9EUKA|nr:Hypothetical protein HINF_LOCUS15774 [Hexamita inflata]CAI9929949.1 Hypothetical protein HINF_LOCUS17594 [Hexamita inflata]CAI9944707.1 Hypothetical protein HINF_LOCUS32352 [Hexamita inflata]